MSNPPVPEQFAAVLAKPNPAVMATLRSDGAPVSVATWYDWEDGRVLLNLAGGRVRLKHLRRDPRVTITVLDHDDWDRHVSLQGRVAEFVDDTAFVDIDRLSTRYGWGAYSNHVDPRVSAWVDVERWHAWGF